MRGWLRERTPLAECESSAIEGDERVREKVEEEKKLIIKQLK